MSTRLKLSAHGAYFAKELRNLRTSIPPNLAFNCLDGQIKCHKDVFAAQMDKASMLYKLLKSHTSPDDYLVTISLPDVLKKDFILLLDLLYTGQFNIFADCEDHLSRLQDLTTFLRINVEAALAFDDIEADFFQPQPELSVETIPLPAKKKSVHLAKQPTDFVKPGDDESASIRRSKRPRTKNKLLDDFETASKIVCEENAIITANALSQEPMDEETKSPNDAWKSNSNSAYKTCYICRLSVLGLHGLTRHLRDAHGEENGPFPCPICRQPLDNGSSMHEHVRDHEKGLINSEGAASNRCHECELDFRTKNALVQHLSAEHSRRKNGYRCPEVACRWSCQTAKAFADHMVSRHGKKPFECEHCSMRYMHKANLEEHMKTKHGTSSSSLVCDVCDKEFGTRASLFVHKKEQHELGDKRLVKCDVCSFVSKGMRNLKKHKEIHDSTAYQKFQCLYCSRMFRSKNSLTVHERVHTGEAPYRCEVCAIRFKRVHHLHSHLKCANHNNKVKQLEAEGRPVPDPVCSVNKEQPAGAQQIYVTTTEILQNDPASTVQVVELTTNMADALLQPSSAVLLASADDYQQFVID